MEAISFYHKVVILSLFQGLSESDLENIFGTFKFSFRRYRKGTVLADEGMSCQELMLLTDGEIQTERSSEKHSYKVVETFRAPCMLQPERLYGIAHFYTSRITALTDVNAISIDKNELQRLFDTHLIVKLNYLNTLSAKLQNAEKKSWLSAPQQLTDRIRRFVKAHTESPTGRKEVHIKMEQLARELNDSRLNTSIALHKLETAGLIELRRGGFAIPQMEHFLSEEAT